MGSKISVFNRARCMPVMSDILHMLLRGLDHEKIN